MENSMKSNIAMAAKFCNFGQGDAVQLGVFDTSKPFWSFSPLPLHLLPSDLLLLISINILRLAWGRQDIAKTSSPAHRSLVYDGLVVLPRLYVL